LKQVLDEGFETKGFDLTFGEGNPELAGKLSIPDPEPIYIGDEEDEEEFNKIESALDKLLIYKLFAGAGEYLSVSDFSGNTSQFDPLLGKVQSSYGWKREKYSAFTDAVSAYLVSVGYDVPKQIATEADRQAFSKIFKDLAKVLE
jgi:hypothetical protein